MLVSFDQIRSDRYSINNEDDLEKISIIKFKSSQNLKFKTVVIS